VACSRVNFTFTFTFTIYEEVKNTKAHAQLTFTLSRKLYIRTVRSFWFIGQSQNNKIQGFVHSTRNCIQEKEIWGWVIVINFIPCFTLSRCNSTAIHWDGVRVSVIYDFELWYIMSEKRYNKGKTSSISFCVTMTIPLCFRTILVTLPSGNYNYWKIILRLKCFSPNTPFSGFIEKCKSK